MNVCFDEIGHMSAAFAAESGGYGQVCANGSGGVKAGSAGKSRLVVSVDTDAKIATIEL